MTKNNDKFDWGLIQLVGLITALVLTFGMVGYDVLSGTK